jgi:heme/copper-type cytochrome/quinol oxidase subunit 4
MPINLPDPQKLAEKREERRHTLMTVVYGLLRVVMVIAVAGIAWWLWLAN